MNPIVPRSSSQFRPQPAALLKMKGAGPQLRLAGLLACLLVCGCAASPKSRLERFTFAEPHMGTLFSIVLYAPDGQTATNAAQAAFARVAALNQAMSDYDDESELMRLCRQPAGTPVKVSRELFDVLEQSLKVAGLTDGAFDPTVGEFTQLWRRARRQRELPAPERIARARESFGWWNMKLDARMRTVTLLKSDMRLDLGGIAKGCAADAALAVLREQGIRRALVAASGDIVAGDPPPGQPGWRVGVQSMSSQADGLTRTLLLANRAVSTSGDTEQFVEIGGVRYSHIVDPRTGFGLTDRLGVTVIARDSTTADALATALSVAGVERGLALVEARPDLAALIVTGGQDGMQRFESRRFARFVAP
jgi:FAD:protein FMN transferase